MGWYYKLPLNAKLLGSFTLIIVLTCIITGYAIYSMRQSQQVATYVNWTLEERYGRIERTTLLVSEFQNSMYEYIINQNPAASRTMKNQADQATDAMLNIINSLSTANFPTEINALRSLTTDLAQIYRNQISSMVEQGQVREAVEYYSDNMLLRFNDCFFNLTKIRQGQIKATIQEVNSAADTTPMIIVTVVAIVAIVLGLAIAFMTAGYIKSALNGFTTCINRLAERDFSHKIQLPFADEFGHLSNTLENLRSNQASMMQSLAQMSEHISEEMQTANNAVKRLSQNATDSESRTISVAAAANEMVATTQDIARNCDVAAGLANKSTEMTSDGMEKAKTSINAIYEQAEQTKANNKQIDAMIKQSHSINGIVNTIDEIAAQTNLLALNAAIEAARAGEAGRGFAVVADEVRALASRTSRSTSEITDMVSKMEDDANIATESMSRAVLGMSTLADNTSVLEHVLNEILEQVRSVNSQITQIATAAEQQTTATNEISTNMQDLTTATREVANIANETQNIIDSTTSAIEQLANTMKSFRF